MAEQITLRQTANNLNTTARRQDDTLLDPELFASNPLIYYKKVLQEVFSYKQFNEAQEFIGIVLPPKTITSEERQAFIGALSPKPDINYSFCNVIIPELDACIPLPRNLKDTETINAFYNSNSRVAYYTSGQPIFAGSIVVLANALLAEKNKKPCEIIRIHSSQFNTFAEIEKKRDVIQACIKKKLQTKGPEDIIYPQMISGLGIIASSERFQNKTIFSSKNFTTQQEAKKASPINFPIGNGTNFPENVPVSSKEEILSKIIFKPADILKDCDFDPIQNPQQGTQEVQEQSVDEAFVRDNKAIQQQKVNLPQQFFSTYSNNEKKLVIRPAEDPNSLGPIIKLPPDSRNVSMIVVRNIPYLTAKEYHKLIKETKIPAVHFCIDNNGDTFQFTDTKNLVKAYNPTIDEISIYIGIMNISFRNSNRTLDFYRRGITRSLILSSANTRAANNALQLKTSSSNDELKLRLFYNAKGTSFTDKQPLDLESILDPKDKNSKINLLKKDLSDGRTLFPPYRLDMTENQKKSLNELINSIISSYGSQNIKKQFPQVLGYDPEVASGQFSGIVSPLHFTFEESDPINLHMIIKG